MPNLETPNIQKLNGIYELASKKHRKERFFLAGSISSLGIMLFTGFLGAAFGIDNIPIFLQPLVVQISFAGMVISTVFAIALVQKSRLVSFEKRIFLKVFEAYKRLSRYNNLVGSPSQEHQDLEKGIDLLYRVCLVLKERANKNVLSDIGKEVNVLRCNLSNLIQTRILSSLQKGGDLKKDVENVLLLADTFADISYSKFQSCIGQLESLQELSSFKPKPPFIESHPKLRSYLLHFGRLCISIIVVLAVALMLSLIFQKQIADFAPYILGSIFVLFVTWEFRSR